MNSGAIHTVKLFVYLCILLFVGPSHGDIYQCQDRSGKTHFSDIPPAAKTSTVIEFDDSHSVTNTPFKQFLKEKGKRVLKRVSNGEFYQYAPLNIDKVFAVVVVNHGMFSNDKTARDAAFNASRRWQRFSEETGAMIIAPVFDNYHYAVTTDGPQRWGYRGLFGRQQGADFFLNEIIAYYQGINPFYDGKIFLSGHSAGAQFANRYLVRHPDKVHAAAFSAPAWFALPTDRLAWPNGMGNRYRVVRWPGESQDKIIDIKPDRKGWLEAAQLPVTVVVGKNDVKKIRHVDGVGGDTHVDRAIFWVKSMIEFAQQHSAEGRVELNLVDNVGHNFGKLAAVCQDAMKDQIKAHLNNEKQRIRKNNN